MEAVCISTTGSPCEELYSDIRADSFDVLTGQFNTFSVNFPINYPALSSNSDSCENFDSTGTESFQFMNSGVIESVYLNTEIDKQGDVCLLSVHAVGRSPRSDRVKLAVGSADELSDKGNINVGSHSKEKLNASSVLCPALNGIEEHDFGDQTLGSLCHPARDFDVGCLGADKRHRENNDEGVMLLTSVNVVQTETGSTQMFLLDDPGIHFDKYNSRSNSSCLETNKLVPDDIPEKVTTLDLQEGIANKDKIRETHSVRVDVQESTYPRKLFSDDISTNTCIAKLGRRSVAVNSVQNATSLFSSRTFSDSKDATDCANKNPNIGDVKQEISKVNSQAAKIDRTCKVKLYTCNMCNVVCKAKTDLKRHKQLHIVSKLVACTLCGFVCKRKSEMRKHKEIHGTENMYKCTECGYSSKRLKYLKKHIDTHSEVLLSCHLCGFEARNKEGLDKHLCEHSSLKLRNCGDCAESLSEASEFNHCLFKHADNNVSNHSLCESATEEDAHLKKPFEKHETASCVSTKMCVNIRTDEVSDPSGDDKGNNMQHIKTIDNTAVTTEIIIEDCKKTTSKESQILLRTSRLIKIKGRALQCTMCNYSCMSKNMLTHHIKQHSGNKSCVCPQCGASFRRKDHLKVHQLTHNDLCAHKCPICGFQTHHKHRLRLHVITHQNNKPFKCSVCVFRCKRECDLRYHLKNKHSVESQTELSSVQMWTAPTVLKCQICDYTCDSHKRLKYHMTRHQNKTPHRCPHCEYKCSSRSSLADHLRQHAGVKPCLCSECGIAFRNTSRLNRHKLVHSDVKPYSCSFCDFSSRSKYNLKQHTLRHTDQQKARRRKRKLSKPDDNNFNGHEIIQQGSSNNIEAVNPSFNAQVQILVNHLTTNTHLDNVQPHRDDNYLTDRAKNIPEVIETSQETVIPQCIMRNQMNLTSDYYKERDKIIEQSSNIVFNAECQNANLSINPYHVDRTPYPNVVNQIQTKSDAYSNLNPFFGHPPCIPYGANVNTGHTNSDFSYVDRNASGYGLTNPYFYNETLFPGNVNTNMSFYMYQNGSNNYAPIIPGPSICAPIISGPSICAPIISGPSICAPIIPGPSVCAPVVPGPSTSINENMFHLNQPASEITMSVLPQQSESPGIVPSLPVVQSLNQYISGVEDSRVGNLSLGEEVSGDAPAVHSSEKSKPPEPRSQAKKTGATLSGSRIVKNRLGDSTTKSTHICSECGYICLSNTMLQRHKITHVDLKPHKCDDCGKSFKRADHMKAHKRSHDQRKPHSCQHCSYTCSRKYQLKVHEMTHTSEHPFPCSVCESHFNSEQQLDEHMGVHSDGFVFTCNKCDVKCKDKTELKSHRHVDKSYICAICSYVCRSAREFNSHKRMHGKKDELVCSLCSYTCDSQKRLKYHMRRHENKTPYECPHCDYKCSSRSSLTDHLLQHDGIKPFLCSVCGMKFRNVSRLNRHKMTHTDLKPYTCDYCPFSSKSKYNLKQHILRHFK